MGEVASEGGAIRSLSEMGAMLTMLTTGTSSMMNMVTRDKNTDFEANQI